MASDDVISKVQAALDSDENLRSYGLEAQGSQEKITISGVVDVLAEKWHAERVAKAVPGVGEVENAITISTDGQIDDGDVRFEVGEELGLYPEDELRLLSIEANKGVVTLRGRLSRPELKEKAIQAAAKARGVVGVVSKINVEE